MDLDDLFSEFSIKIYEEPLSDLRTSGAIRDLSNPISVAMLIVDFNTEVEMNGILNFIGNSTGLYARETVEALRTVGCERDAEKLREILDIADIAGMTHAAIQADRSNLEAFAVTSFSSLHGDKWDDATTRVDSIADEVDFGAVLTATESFIGQHKTTFEKAVAI